MQLSVPVLFQAPFLLWLLPLVPLVALTYWVAQRRRHRFALRYPSISIVQGMQKYRGWRRHLPPLLFLATLTAMIVALARPAIVTREPSDEGIVILTLDVSASMWAPDLYPSRMEAAKAAALVFGEEVPAKMRVGVVSFSTNAYLNLVPTTDRTHLKAAIKKLEPRSGTAIGSGIVTSLDAINGALGYMLPFVQEEDIYAPAVIILLSDGENTDGPSPLEIIEEARDHGIRVYTIGIGSPESQTIRRNAMAIQARLDEETLRLMAERTHAVYYNASTEKDLRAVYEKLTTQIVMRNVPHEVTFGFISAAFVLGTAALLFSVVCSNRLP